MTKEELYDEVLEDFVNGNIYDHRLMIKDLILLLTPEAVAEFAHRWDYGETQE